MEGMNDFDDSGNVDVKKKEKNDDVIDDSDLRRNDSDDNDDNGDNGDSDTSFAVDMSLFKKGNDGRRHQKTQANTIYVRSTEKFYDKNGKECMFIIMKFNFWALKANIMEAAISTLFNHAIKGKMDVKKLFGNCWNVEERDEPFSIQCKNKVSNGYPQYVLLIQVIVDKYTVMSAVDIIIENIRRFMKSKSFPECYKLSFREDMKNKLYTLVSDESHELYTVCKNLTFQKTYSNTLDCLVHDDAIYRIFMLVTNKTKRELLACGMCSKIMFKNPSAKHA